MSITIQITNSPLIDGEKYECMCVGVGPETGADTSCPYCHGTGVDTCSEPAWPWVNLSNVNAMNILRAIGVTPDFDGEIEGKGLDAAISGCLRALNDESRRFVAVREPEHIPCSHAGVRVVDDGDVTRIERMGAETHIGGYSDDRVLMRIYQVLDILRKAKDEGEAVVWG